VLERHWGSKRFGSVFVVSTLISTLLNTSALYVAKAQISRMTPGLNGFLYALVFFYLKDIPTSYQIKLMGFTFTDHFFLCALAMQVMIVYSAFIHEFDGLAYFSSKRPAGWPVDCLRETLAKVESSKIRGQPMLFILTPIAFFA
jgi:membrane associated rhomboid family serine protease